MSQSHDFPCPCGSDKPYAKCCRQYHKGASPERAEALMRSRYSAYALNLPNYIIKTTHPENPGYIKNQSEWEEELLSFSESTNFEKLDVIEVEDGEEMSFVTFTAHLKHDGKDASFTEKSRFKRVDDRWLYLDGEFV